MQCAWCWIKDSENETQTSGVCERNSLWPGAASTPAPRPPRRPPPAAATRGSKGTPAGSARAIPGQGPRGARYCPETSARARAQAGREEKDPAEGLAAGGGLTLPRPALPRGWTRAPPTSPSGRSVSSSTRLPARVLPSPLPLPSRTLALLPHLCAGCSRRWEHPAFPQPSGDPGGGGGGGRGALWPGRRRGETKGGRGLKPEPQRGGSREAERGAFSRPEEGREQGSCAPRASASPAGSPEMHLHQVLTGAVNPGDNCYSVGSVDVLSR